MPLADVSIDDLLSLDSFNKASWRIRPPKLWATKTIGSPACDLLVASRIKTGQDSQSLSNVEDHHTLCSVSSLRNCLRPCEAASGLVTEAFLKL